MNEPSLLINLSFLLTQPTGLTTYATNLFPHLKALKPILLTSEKVSGFRNYSVPNDLTQAQGTKGNFKRLAWTQFKLPQIYENLQSSLLFSPIPEAPIYTSCRFVITVHDLIPLRFPRHFSALTLYYRQYLPHVLAHAEHIICDSWTTVNDLQSWFNIPENKATVIPLAYADNHFRPLTTEKPSVPYFLYIGRHDPHKNLVRMLRAFAALPQLKDYQLWITSSSDRRYTPQLKTLVNELGIAPQVKFLEYIPYEQLPLLLNQALALVLPSLWEGFGLPVLEAMACGCPVITSNLSSLPEVAGDAALLVNPYRVVEITAALKTIATDEKVRSHLRTQGLERAKQFTWQKTGKATADLLYKYL